MNWTYWVTADVSGESEPSVYKLDLDCTLIHSRHGGFENWEDTNCNDTNHFVCQYELGKQIHTN